MFSISSEGSETISAGTEKGHRVQENSDEVPSAERPVKLTHHRCRNWEEEGKKKTSLPSLLSFCPSDEVSLRTLHDNDTCFHFYSISLSPGFSSSYLIFYMTKQDFHSEYMDSLSILFLF